MYPQSVNEKNYANFFSEITPNEAEKIYTISKDISFPFMDFEKQPVCIYKGNLSLNELLSGDSQNQTAYNLIIDGNLTVENDIKWSDERFGSFLLVTGDLQTNNLYIKGSPNVAVRGNLIAKHAIIGINGDDGGTLKVNGSTKTQSIYNNTYFHMIFASKPISTLIISDMDGVNCDVDFEPDELSNVIDKRLLKKGKNISEDDLIIDALMQGTAVLKPGAMSASALLSAKLENLLEQASEITKLDLKEKKLKKLPDIIFQFPNLRMLNLSGNELKTLPAKIGDLKYLEELYISGNAISELPPELEDLTSLRTLSISGYGVDCSVPKIIAKLSNLRTLTIHGLYTIPEELSALTQLEVLELKKLNCDGTDKLAVFPSVVYKLKSLKTLSVSAEVVYDGITEQLENLTQLEDLTIEMKTPINNRFPDMSKFPKLRRLCINSTTNYKYADLTFFDRLTTWNIPSLEEIVLYSWNAQYTFKGYEKVTIFPGLKQLGEDVFVGMPSLQRITIYGEKMETLPESLYKLKNLKALTLKNDNLNQESQNRLKTTFGKKVKVCYE